MSSALKYLRQPVVLRVLVLFFGIFCGATAVIMIKASTEQPLLIAAYRLLIAAVALSPFFFRDLRTSPEPYTWQHLRWAALPAVILAVNFMAWVFGARMTQVASASLISNLTPVAMPFFLWAFYRERVTRREVLGTVFTLAGLVLLTGSSLSISHTNFIGDLVCLGTMLTFACYLALGRKNAARISLWRYIVPLYFMAGLICLVCASIFINPVKAYTLPNVLYILGLGLIPTVIGHTSLNFAMKYFRGQVVGVANLTQPLFSSVLGFFFLNEQPTAILYISAAVILVGVLIVLFAGGAPQQSPNAELPGETRVVPPVEGD
ncbi:MAG TPA: DMT family transporter [Anaerolineaceae bacterium]|jgi:drug/metabolite transporter (DMT)-like permease